MFANGSFIPTARITDKGSQSIVTDYLGTPTQMYDANGNKTWEAQLDIYGRVRTFAGSSLSDCPFRYQGQYQDEETGLYYNRFRYYDSETGSYISQDPIGLAGGNPTIYGYVKDVNSWVDELGLKCTKHGKTAEGREHFSGTDKPMVSGATPNSIYTHIDPNTGKAIQNAIYDGSGNVIGHVDFKNHGIPSGHYHSFPTPGNPASGHGVGKPHFPNSTIPSGWDILPHGVSPHTPIGT